VTQSHSERALPVDDLAELVVSVAGQDSTFIYPSFDEAVTDARAWAAQSDRRGVLITGSIILVGEAIALARQEGWR
jgi:dihydrofolate synthase/folylpolyglutamate synthase